MKQAYEENEDFREFVDKNCQTYGKSVDYMLSTPTTQEYYKFLVERGRINGKESKQEQGRDLSQADQG